MPPMRGQQISEADHPKVLRAYLKAGSRAVAAKFGVSHQYILNIVKKYGATRSWGVHAKRRT